MISAEVLGRQARMILVKSDILEKRILSVLASNLDAEQVSKIARDWAKKKDWEITYALKVLRAFQKGLQ